MPVQTHHDLETMDRAALCALWADINQSAPPSRMSQRFMRQSLAFDLQAAQFGGLSKGVAKTLDKPPERKTHQTVSQGVEPGGRLMREWNGVTHVVEVTSDGFQWNGATYRSLSAIARAITGAHWSGPRFFGLNKAQGK